MPLLIVLLSLALSSCSPKDSETLKGEQSFLSRNENTVFMTIDHPKASSLLREKLLNTIVQTSLNEPLATKEHAVESRDEFVVNGERQELAQREEISYKENEFWMTKVVVSFQDRVEIFFVPDEILLSRLIPILHLKPDAERTFVWVNPHIKTTYRGNTLYLISLNHGDLMKNDENFYQEKHVLGKEYAGKSFSVLRSQTIKFRIKYEYFVQNGGTQVFKGNNNYRCTRDLQEADMCYVCTYKRVVNGGNFEKVEMNDIDRLGMEIVIDGNSFKPTQLVHEMESSGAFNLFVKSDELIKKDVYDFSLRAVPAPSVTRTSSNFDFPPGCVPLHTSSTEQFGAESSFQVEVYIYGRGEKLRAVLL